MNNFRRLVQIIFSILSILALIAAISLFVEIPRISEFVVMNMINNETLRIITTVILGLILLIAILELFSAIFARSLQNRLELDKEAGTISLSKDAVIHTALSSISHMPQVMDAQADARLFNDPADTEVDMHVQIYEADDVISMSERIQELVKIAVSRTLGVEVEKINVDIEQIDKDSLNEIRKNKRKRNSRVV